MHIQILSDLHNESYDPPPDITQTKADVVILAGDIDIGISGIEWASKQAEKLGKPIIYVSGNHEYFGFEYNALLGQLKTSYQDSPLIFLENSSVIINGVRFLGCTLWTDLSAGGVKEYALYPDHACMAEYQEIDINDSGSNRMLEPADTLKLHEVSASWLKSELSKDFDGETVVITHHAPVLDVPVKDQPYSYMKAYYINNLKYLMGVPKLWVYGHTHIAFDQTINDTRVISNPRGYFHKPEVGFNDALIALI